jgi:predicted O-methyltransferase YrrM
MDPVAEYIRGFVATQNADLARIAEEETLRGDTQPSIGEEVGRFLALLIRATQAKRVMELGTSLGYSTVWLAQTLRETGGTLTSIENDGRLHADTQRNVSAAGLSGVVELVLGDARVVLDRLKGPFDLILQDSDKTIYPQLLSRCIDLTREGGVIVADDTLFKPRGVPEKFSTPVHQYNEMVFADRRLYSTILPIGDGITVVGVQNDAARLVSWFRFTTKGHCPS